MKMKYIGIALVFISLLIAPSFLQAAENCDRQCLVDLMKDYLAALVAHDPSAVPFDRYVKFTQNTAEIPVGYGLWETASGGPSEFQNGDAGPSTVPWTPHGPNWCVRQHSLPSSRDSPRCVRTRTPARPRAAQRRHCRIQPCSR